MTLVPGGVPGATRAATWAGTASLSGPRSRWNAPRVMSPPGGVIGRADTATGAMFTVSFPASAPGPTITIEPSEPWTMPPPGPRTAGPASGASTLTGISFSAGPLMTVIVAIPGAPAVTRPSGLTLTTVRLLT